jgi:hypothetical protein
MNARDAALVAKLIAASRSAACNSVDSDGSIPEKDLDRVNVADEEWGWSVLSLYGINQPFGTAAEAYEWVKARRR